MKSWVLAVAVAWCACAGERLGALTVVAAPDGAAAEALATTGTSDGWTIQLERALLAVQAVQASSPITDSGQVLNLLGASSVTLVQDALPVGSQPAIVFVVQAPQGVGPGGDPGFMSAHGYAVYVEGTAARTGVTKAFHWGFSAATQHTCRPLQTVAGDPLTLSLTFDVTTLFLDDLVSPNPRLAFDLIAQADANGDGDVGEAELRSFDISSQDRYQVGSTRIDRLWDFLEYLAGDIGDLPGQSACSVETLSDTH